jgi:hypothetical protein
MKAVEEIELSARMVFPAGSLPDESDPLSFTPRELGIIKQFLHQTSEMEQRVRDAKKLETLVRQGARFSHLSPDGVIIPPKIPTARLKGILPKPVEPLSLEEMDLAIEAGATERFRPAKGGTQH